MFSLDFLVSVDCLSFWTITFAVWMTEKNNCLRHQSCNVVNRLNKFLIFEMFKNFRIFKKFKYVDRLMFFLSHQKSSANTKFETFFCIDRVNILISSIDSSNKSAYFFWNFSKLLLSMSEFFMSLKCEIESNEFKLWF